MCGRLEIVEYDGESAYCGDFEAAMWCRFPSPHVTNDRAVIQMPAIVERPTRLPIASAVLEVARPPLQPMVRGGLSGSAGDFTRPLLVGYLRRDLLVADNQVTDLEHQMAAFAQAEGFAMGHVFVEAPGNWLAAFEALIESVNRYEAAAVVLPSLLHFALHDSPFYIKAMFEGATGTRVLALHP